MLFFETQCTLIFLFNSLTVAASKRVIKLPAVLTPRLTSHFKHRLENANGIIIVIDPFGRFQVQF